ncbi:restriction system-associated AAA family ATPase [Sphingomonas radiodurans]|uniref:restriction system-associated AAA family ATPase n=1 Tax=Sphingomonas radiodurans TaxID=2890321 RepID=UPI001E3A8EF9|nr:restriction system-associated AAA family ATPase [Sphingomonas radiodurans]WBH15279.1 restriction system-associated AAA family ATPase [Sphingomonas radiodurans]
MRLRLLKIERSGTGGGLFDGTEIWFGRDDNGKTDEPLAPLCMIGPNGSGKSQFLQLIAEIFQAAWHAHDPAEERRSANDEILFDLEYVIRPPSSKVFQTARLVRALKGKKPGPIELFLEDGNTISAGDSAFGQFLPTLIIGYTSGDNETLSLPFLASRSGYARDVAKAARQAGAGAVLDNRLMLIDYGTNLEVLFSNLMLGSDSVRTELLRHARLGDLASCRCIVRLAHPAVPKIPKKKRVSSRKGIQLTEELETVIANLQRIATCWHVDDKTETYTFDFLITEATRQAFAHFWSDAFSLYRSLHKLALLNDLAIPRPARKRFDKAVKERRFASRLPEPQQEDMVFSFEEVRFWPEKSRSNPVDYVSLSDGEHQQALILGTYAMIADTNALFLLDEPESHFNPKWRVEFVQQLMKMVGKRGNQEFLLTTHAPFVPSDMPRDQVMIFSRDEKTGKFAVRDPQIETFGTTFDRILESCFGIRPPNSHIAEKEIEKLLKSNNVAEIEEAFQDLGPSIGKALLADHLRKLKNQA